MRYAQRLALIFALLGFSHQLFAQPLGPPQPFDAELEVDAWVDCLGEQISGTLFLAGFEQAFLIAPDQMHLVRQATVFGQLTSTWGSEWEVDRASSAFTVNGDVFEFSPFSFHITRSIWLRPLTQAS